MTTTSPETDSVDQADTAVKKVGRRLVLLSISNLVALVVIAALVTVVSSQADIIGRLVGNTTQLRAQVQTCADKPARTPGCKEPVGEAPEVIVKKVSVPIPGLQGVPGGEGVPGKPGVDGQSYGCDGKLVDSQHPAAKCPGLPGAAATPAVPAKDGRDGITPECMQTPRQCQGEDGKPAKDGVDGITPPCYFTPMQCQGADGKTIPPDPPFSVIDMDCVGDDTASIWVTKVSNGKDQQTINGAGPCRIGPDPN